MEEKAHRPECLAHQERMKQWQRSSDEWKARWPKHCPKCLGAGGFHSAGSYWEPPDFSECACTADGLCPRCGGELGEDACQDDKPCPHCGWEWGRGKDDATSEPDEGLCVCWEYEPDPEPEEYTWPPCSNCGKESSHGEADLRTGNQRWLCDDCAREELARGSGFMAPGDWGSEPEPLALDEAERQAMQDAMTAEDRYRDTAVYETFAEGAWERAEAAPWGPSCTICGGQGCPDCP